MRYDLQNFTNIDDKDFIGKWAGEEYLIKAGETKAYPEFLVAHFTKHLINRLLMNTRDYSDRSLRDPLEKKIRGEVVLKKEEEVKKDEGKQVKEEVEKSQKEFAELELKRKEETKAKRIEALKKAREAKKNKK